VPSIGHLAVGFAAARVKRPPVGLGAWVWTPLLVALSFLPDVDVVAFRMGIPYGAPFGHRGAFHSLAFAALVGGLLWAIARFFEVPGVTLALTGSVVVASHGLLDTLTDGGRGIALLWPFSLERYFAPWRPIAVAPIGARIFSSDGIVLMAREALLFLPLWVMAAWPPRTKRRKPTRDAERSKR
jgi:inner membrane protein